MHWTLSAMLMLCAGCALLNIVQIWVTSTARLSGVLVCLLWCIQQLWWSETGSESVALMLGCDAVLAAYLLHRRASNNWTDWLILALIPATIACYLRADFLGQTTFNWWLNWSLVAVQMILGLPRPRRQEASSFYSHGPLRSLKYGGA